MITLQTDKNNKDIFNELIINSEINSKLIEKKNFNGQTEVIELICTLTATSIPIIASIIITSIKSKKNVEIKYKGTTIKGISESNAIKILTKLMDKK